MSIQAHRAANDNALAAVVARFIDEEGNAMLKGAACLQYAGLMMVVSLVTAAQPSPGVFQVKEFYVLYKAQPSGASTPDASLGLQRAMTLSGTAGVALTHVRTLRDGAYVMRSDRLLTRAQAWAVAEKLARSDGVAVAQPINPEFDARPPVRPASSLPRSIGGTK